MERTFTRSDKLVMSIGRQASKIGNSFQAGVDFLAGRSSYKHSFMMREMAEDRREPNAHLITGYAAIAYATGIILALTTGIANSLRI